MSYHIMSYQLRPRLPPRPRPRDAMEDLFFFRNFTLEKVILKNIKNAKKNRLKILYRTPYLKNRDLFSRTNFDTFLFSCNMCIL